MRRVRLQNTWGITLNLTAMVDVVFQMIVFFLCISLYERENRKREPVQLPEAKLARKNVISAEANRLVINILPDESVLIEDRAVPLNAVASVVTARQRAIGAARLEVWIRADRRIPYRIVGPVLQACATAGVSKLAFKVLSKTEESAGAQP